MKLKAKYKVIEFIKNDESVKKIKSANTFIKLLDLGDELEFSYSFNCGLDEGSQPRHHYAPEITVVNLTKNIKHYDSARITHNLFKPVRMVEIQ